jgi:nucleoid DNA-binding protein
MQKSLFRPADFAFFIPCRVYGCDVLSARRGAARDAERGGNAMATKKSAAGGSKKSLSKSALIQAITESAGEELSRKQVKAVLEALTTVGHRELKKSGVFTLPGFAKFRVVKRPATKARQGINPFTKQPMTFPAKPASTD